ncbi:LuxR C-terminal-related transcriptional regulator [bacterium]|nr:LuxR C-terminal-related transcriptional regulator [bacterium]
MSIQRLLLADDSLTARESQVLKGIVQGKMNKVLADELSLSIKTIEMYRARLRKKYNVKTIAELIVVVITSSQESR